MTDKPLIFLLFLIHFFALTPRSFAQVQDNYLAQIEQWKKQMDELPLKELQEGLPPLFLKIKTDPKATSLEKVKIATQFLRLAIKVEDTKKGSELVDFVAKLPPLSEVYLYSEWKLAEGHFYISQYNYLQAVDALETCSSQFESHPNPDLGEQALAYNDLGFSYGELGMHDQARRNYYKAFEIWSTSFRDEIGLVTSVLNNLIFSELDYGNMEAAQSLLDFYGAYVKQTLAEDNLKKEDSWGLELLYRLNRVRWLEAKLDTDAIVREIETIEKLFAKTSRQYQQENLSILYSSYEAASYVFRKTGDFSQALLYNEKLETGPFPLEGFFLMKYQANQAMIYFYAGDNSRSLENVELAIKTFDSIGLRGSSRYTLQVLQAELFANLGQHEKARSLVTSIFSGLLEKELKTSDLEHIQYAELSGLNDARYLTILVRAGHIFLQINEHTPNNSDRRTALNLFRLTAEMFQTFYHKGNYNASLEELAQQLNEGLLSLLVTSGTEVQIPALNLLENNASQLLWKKFLINNSDNLGLDQNLLRDYNFKMLELDQSEGASTEQKALEQELQILEEKVKENRAVEFFETENLDLENLQKTLSNQQHIIRYYVAQDHVFGLKIGSHTTELFRLGTKEEIQTLTDDLYSQLQSPQGKYQNSAGALYQKLWAPLNIPSETPVQIIPENFLFQLPFEVLKDKNGEFLISKNSVAYQYSLRWMGHEKRENGHKNRKMIAGFAPDYSGTSYPDIRFHQDESQRIIGSLRGDLFVGNEASKRGFVASMGEFRIHHLAMHAVQEPANYEQSALIFSQGEKLQVRELYQMNFPSQLVVLSACNTGMGSLLPGEGLMSLARALTFAGVESSIFSLWAVPDRETSAIMVAFYEGIQKGLPKDLALAEAKRTFLKENPLQSHPYFWAGFVLNGDTGVIPTGANFSLWWMILGITLAGISSFLFFRRRRSQA